MKSLMPEDGPELRNRARRACERADGLQAEVEYLQHALSTRTKERDEARAKAAHQPTEVWAERRDEISWRCLCGMVTKHQPLPAHVNKSTALVCPNDA